MNRVVRKITGPEAGTLFIETPPRLWRARLDASVVDASMPSPMPVGHQMFSHPEHYGCERVSEDSRQLPMEEVET